MGRYGGGISSIRTDDLAAIPLIALMERNPSVDWGALDDVLLGCANQSGEDNRNVARMAGLLAGLPLEVPGCTINRLCGSGMNAVGTGANAIEVGEADLVIAGGVESMSRAPFVMGKAESAYGRTQTMYDTTMGWRFINRKLDAQYGTDPMPKTAENLAEEFSISREDQDQFVIREGEYGIAAGDTTEDGLFSLRTARCLGSCGLAPVVVLNGQVSGKTTPDAILRSVKEVVTVSQEKLQQEQEV